jgi:uncharacterized protein YraI
MTPAPQLRVWFGTLLLTLCGSALAHNAVITSSVDVYAGPDDSYPPVAQLEPDTPVQVYGCLDDWSWCDVSFEDNRGWVYAPDITYAYEGGYVPLYSYAPALGIPVIVFSINDYWGRYYHSRPWYGQREEWIRRGPPQHRRPAGPSPSASPPPRSVITQRPRAGDRGDEAIRLGSAEQRNSKKPRIMEAPPAQPGQRAPQGLPETRVPPTVPQHPAAAPSGEEREHGARPDHTERTRPKEQPRAEREDQPHREDRPR